MRLFFFGSANIVKSVLIFKGLNEIIENLSSQMAWNQVNEEWAVSKRQ